MEQPLTYFAPNLTVTFSPGLSQSGQNKAVMILAMIQPFQTKLSPSAECQHKFADIFSFLPVSCRSPIHLHNPCDTAINNSAVICISMPEIEDRHEHKQGPARNKPQDAVYDVDEWNILRVQSLSDRRCLQCTFYLSIPNPSLNPPPPTSQTHKCWENGDLTSPAGPATNSS